MTALKSKPLVASLLLLIAVASCSDNSIQSKRKAAFLCQHHTREVFLGLLEEFERNGSEDIDQAFRAVLKREGLGFFTCPTCKDVYKVNMRIDLWRKVAEAVRKDDDSEIAVYCPSSCHDEYVATSFGARTLWLDKQPQFKK